LWKVLMSTAMMGMCIRMCGRGEEGLLGKTGGFDRV
jgi:hypothetical protein